MGCLSRVLALMILAALLIVAWRSAPGFVETPGRGEPPDPVVAIGLADRYTRALAAGDSVFAVSDLELTALLHREAGRVLPATLVPRAIELRTGEALVWVDLDLPTLLGSRWPDRAGRFLPTVIPFQLRGAPLGSSGGDPVFLVRRIAVGGVPVPLALFQWLWPSGPSDDRLGVPPEAIPLPLPPRVGAVYIDDGVLTLSLIP